ERTTLTAGHSSRTASSPIALERRTPCQMNALRKTDLRLCAPSEAHDQERDSRTRRFHVKPDGRSHAPDTDSSTAVAPLGSWAQPPTASGTKVATSPALSLDSSKNEKEIATHDSISTS